LPVPSKREHVGNVPSSFAVAAAEVKTDRLGQKPDDAGVSIQVK